MSGMLAARMLVEHYDSVTIVERDVLVDEQQPRRGVPQGRQLHGLLARGASALEEILPGVLDEFVAAGGAYFDGSDLSRLHFCMNGHRFAHQGRSHVVKAHGATRPFFDLHVRRRVLECADIHVLDGHDVVDLVSSPDRGRVVGARVAPHAGGDTGELLADLVVDATGRGSRTPATLARLGFACPDEVSVQMRLKYCTQTLRVPPDLHEFGMIVAPVPGRPTGIGMARCENDTLMMLVFGMAGVEPPDDFAGMCAFADDFAPAHVMASFRAATPIGEPTQHRFPSSRWLRYDRLPIFPEGLLVIGDAVCSFNPIYGQGMTVAAVEALVLRDCLGRGASGLAKRFFRASAKPIRQAWDLAVGGDLSLPEIAGEPPLPTRLVNPYLNRVMTAAETDVTVMEQFMRVAWLVDPAVRLFRPGIIARSLLARRRAQPPREPQPYSTVTGA